MARQRFQREPLSPAHFHHDPETNHLFGVLWRDKDHRMASLPLDPVMRRWWDHMADLMQVKADNEPVAVPLQTVFHLA